MVIYSVRHKFKDMAVIPDIGIDSRWREMLLTKGQHDAWKDAVFTTVDDVSVRLEYLGTWIGEQPEVHDFIQKIYKCTLAQYKAYYEQNHQRIKVWNLIRMVRV